MNPNANSRNAKTGATFSDARHAAISFAFSDRGDRPEKYNLTAAEPR